MQESSPSRTCVRYGCDCIFAGCPVTTSPSPKRTQVMHHNERRATIPRKRSVDIRFPSRAFNNALLFLSSFAPLFLALALRFQTHWLRFACLALFLIGSSWIWAALAFWKGRSPLTVIVASCDDRGPDVGGYVAAYLLPLLVVPEPSAGDLGAYLVILLTIGVVYVRSRMMQLNPMLYVMGYRVYSITTENDFTGYLIERNAPRAGDRLHVVRRDNLLLGLEDR